MKRLPYFSVVGFRPEDRDQTGIFKPPISPHLQARIGKELEESPKLFLLKHGARKFCWLLWGLLR